MTTEAPAAGSVDLAPIIDVLPGLNRTPYQKIINRILIGDLLRNLPDNFSHLDITDDESDLLTTLLAKNAQNMKKIGRIFEIYSYPIPSKSALEAFDSIITPLGAEIINGRGLDGVSMFCTPIFGAPIPTMEKIKNEILPLVKEGGIFAFGFPVTTASISEHNVDAWEELRLQALSHAEIGLDNKHRKMLENSGFIVFSEGWQIVKYSHEELARMSQDPFFVSEFFHGADVDQNDLPKLGETLAKSLGGIDSLEVGYHRITARKSKPIAQKPAGQKPVAA